MMLGKRQRPPFKRTTSMTEITLDLNHIPPPAAGGAVMINKPPEVLDHDVNNNPFHGLDHRFASAATVSPRPKSNRRNSVDVVETAPFLKTCFYCKRRLNSGRDIYMYRGEDAFCSPECRQQQINKDERKEKCSLLATKKELAATILTATSSDVSTNTETLAAI